MAHLNGAELHGVGGLEEELDGEPIGDVAHEGTRHLPPVRREIRREIRRDPKGSEGIRRDQKGSEGIRRNQIVGEAVPTKGVPSYRQRPGARRHCPGRGLREAEQEAKVDPRLHPAERRAARRGERQRAQHGAFGRRGRALSRGACTQ